METQQILDTLERNKERLPSKFNVSINFPFDEEEYNFSTPKALLEFTDEQFKLWLQAPEIPEVKNYSMNFLNGIRNQLIRVCENLIGSNSYSFQSWADYLNTSKNSSNKVFLFHSPTVGILINLLKLNNDVFHGALQFIGDLDNRKRTTDEELGRRILSAHYSTRAIPLENEKSETAYSIDVSIQEFNQWRINKTTEIEGYLQDSKKSEAEKNNKQLEIVEKREAQFQAWFKDEAQGPFHEWFSEAQTKRSSLEDTYAKLLQLKEPAEYWKKRGEELQAEAKKGLTILLASIAVIACFLGVILYKAPDYIFDSWFNRDYAKTIRWTLVFITLISFLAFGVRAIVKYMFSSYHLARDSQERQTLTYFFLALKNDTTISDDERKLILQSLFSRAETGLLKDDGAPTMPSGDLFKKP